MKKLVLLLIFLSFPLCAQFNISIPDSISIVVNDKPFEISKTWNDSLKSEAKQNIFYYQLAGYKSYNRKIFVRLRIPQTLSFKQVIRQVILYYGMMDDENEREKLKVWVFPFFVEEEEHAYVKCDYVNNTYQFYLLRWKKENLSSAPTPEEKFIYNQILNNAMQKTMLFAEIPEDAIKEVSTNQDLPIKEIYRIYKKIVLWNTLNN